MTFPRIILSTLILVFFQHDIFIVEVLLKTILVSLVLIPNLYTKEIDGKKYFFLSIMPYRLTSFTITNNEASTRYYFEFDTFTGDYHTYIDTDKSGNVIHERTRFGLSTFFPTFHTFYYSYTKNRLDIL